MNGRWAAVGTAGKVFLAGEYGVLVGGEALVMAVNRRAVVCGARPDPDTDREREAARVLHAALPGLPDGLPAVDTSAMHDAGGAKLGIGSSAAWAAAVAGSALATLGEDLSDPAVRERAWRLGRRVHGGGGSGADVCASVLGGVVRFRIPAASHGAESESGSGTGPEGAGGPGQTSEVAGEPEAERVDLPPSRLPLILWGGSPVPTLGAVAAAREARHRARMAAAVRAGNALTEALLDPAADPIPRVREAADVLMDLTEALRLGPGGQGAEVLRAAQAVVRDYGGAAKPSGAGGGDLVLVYLPEALDAGERDRVVRKLKDARLPILDLPVDERGLTPLDRTHGA